MSFKCGLYSLLFSITFVASADAAPAQVKQQFFPAKGAVRKVVQSAMGLLL
jgi:hypothetical protein